MINKIIKQNYNSVIKLLLVCIAFNFFIVISMILQNAMFYKANFGSANVTQTVNVNTNNNSEKININTCSKEALENLPGIGKVKAERIINNRPYSDIYQIQSVISETLFEKLKGSITT